MRRIVSPGSPYESQIGYARALRDSRHVFVSGTTGFDYATMTIDPGPAAQADQALRNIAVALAEAGAGIEHVCASATSCPTRRISSPAGPSSAADSARSSPPPRCSSPASSTRA